MPALIGYTATFSGITAASINDDRAGFAQAVATSFGDGVTADMIQNIVATEARRRRSRRLQSGATVTYNLNTQGLTTAQQQNPNISNPQPVTWQNVQAQPTQTTNPQNTQSPTPSAAPLEKLPRTGLNLASILMCTLALLAA